MQQDIRFCKAADGAGLAYATSGTGRPLVMAATWLTHLEHQWRSLAWRPWLDAFGEFTVLRHDSRGSGLSDRDSEELSFDLWVSDLACVIEAAGFERFPLLATCWGGPVAIEYASRHPKRVSHLVLYGAATIEENKNCSRLPAFATKLDVAPSYATSIRAMQHPLGQ